MAIESQVQRLEGFNQGRVFSADKLTDAQLERLFMSPPQKIERDVVVPLILMIASVVGHVRDKVDNLRGSVFDGNGTLLRHRDISGY